MKPSKLKRTQISEKSKRKIIFYAEDLEKAEKETRTNSKTEKAKEEDTSD